ncbi:glycine cleavage system aminomethyltransferase GcvT [Petrocella sp. FN5]|uniref:glycine cleavage system aminomethyltransferase GcvT n=1 Tax=Petrocella sp. FN5 TaxID=3032002 RepID=UPI0023DBA2ED|nr:glycine cleavage system aminomethyltransferase GcvT [Petrocella sp. FN5]MDF1617965.1 glycine cleavage system aminomethyltransferase GcvT [Petrocella sp. FN5]
MGKRTCLYDMHIQYNAKIVDFAGFDMPIQYEGIMDEHAATRNAIGLFDVSHMGKFELKGEEAKSCINYLVTNDLTALVDGQAMYAPMCYEDGGTVDDILVYQHAPNNLLLVVNAGNKDKDYKWIESHLLPGVDLKDITNELCQLAVQGPKSVALILSLTNISLGTLKYYHFLDQVVLADVPMLISRTGYTGEDGFELYFDKKDAQKIWTLLLEEGSSYGIKPCGLGARDTLRFEAGMPLYGNELSETINPLEAGLGYFVKLDGEDFIGKSSLLEYKVQPKRKLVGFELMDKGIARHGAQVLNPDEERIGAVTTGYISPTLGKSIGLALIPYAYDKDNILVQVRKNRLEAKIINKKFLKQ